MSQVDAANRSRVQVLPDAAGPDAQPGEQRPGVEQLGQELSRQQVAALAAIAQGQTITGAAEAAKVSRVTVYRWLDKDAAFRATYNAWIAEQKESARARLVRLLEPALAKVEAALRTDPKLAYALLKDMGILARIPDGHTEPKLLAREIQVIEKEKELIMNKREERRISAELGLRSEDISDLLRTLMDKAPKV